MNRKLVLTDQAEVSLRAIALAIAEASQSRTTAERLIYLLQAKCQSLAALPGTLGRARPELGDDIRSFAIGNYVIFFRYLDETLEVIDVLDGRRDVESYFYRA